MKRKSTGKKLRFRVFERDGFTCQYCGEKPPEVILHLDHIFPVSKGGKEEIENMITACADCNLGKSTMELGKAPKQIMKNSDDLQERYDQLKAFYGLQKKMQNVKSEMIVDLSNYWNDIWDGDSLTSKGKSSIKRFMRSFSNEQIKEAMDIAREKLDNSSSGFKYTCGVLHTKLKQRGLPENNNE